MLLHVALFRFHDWVADAELDALEEALATFPARVGCILDYRYGRDLGLREGNADYAIVALVAGPEELHRYLDHPAHHALLADHLGALIAQRSAAQITVVPPIGEPAG